MDAPFKMPYCPYTNANLTLDQCSPEHIIPLALGGVDSFVIPVERAFNSLIGSKIDGAMANDFFILNRRNKHSVKGHSRTHPVFVAKKAKGLNTNRPLQIHLDEACGLKVWDPVSKSVIEGPLGEGFGFSVLIDIHLGIRFCAKVALSAGQFVYGDFFQNCIRHDELRLLMNNSLDDLGDGLKNFETLVDTDLQSEKQIEVQVFRHICELASPFSVVGIVPSAKRMTTFVGVLGRYVGMLNTPAFTDQLPREGDFDLGHVVYLKPGVGLTRMSFRSALSEIVAPSINLVPPKPFQEI